MSELVTLKVPDIGDFSDVEVIEVLVKTGDRVEIEQSLITVESDKASMEIPATQAGVITSVLVKPGDKVSTGSDVAVIDAAEAATAGTKAAPAEVPAAAPPTESVASSRPAPFKSGQVPEHPDFDVVVIGAGPGGYTAAFRAADLGLKVLLVERYPSLGGVCLNVGCIPSKALLHTAAVIDEAAEMDAHGVSFGAPSIDIDKLRGFKESVIKQLTGGLAGLAKQRKVEVATGVARFETPYTISIASTGDSPDRTVSFRNAIIAAGSSVIRLPGFPWDDPRLIDSTGALALTDIPGKMLVVGGGIIGLEMGSVYASLGTAVTVVELSDGLIPGCDRDLVRPLEKRLKKHFAAIHTGSKVSAVRAESDGLHVDIEGKHSSKDEIYDKVLVAIGRSPNGKEVNAEGAGVAVTDRGFIPVDSAQRTNIPHIYAIGDIVGQPMLAHKATHEGKVAAENCAGQRSAFDARTIPSVAYTDPEVAWMGLTETAAKESGTKYEKASFPWAASGRALSLGRSEGATKILYDPDTHRLLGCGIVGPNAGELIAEAVLALEMGADIQDIALTVHPHPTLSETFNFAAEMAEGTITDLYVPKKKTKA